MTDRCVKCGCTTIVGPRYLAGGFGVSERLRYACARCGYAWDGPTCDVSDAHPSAGSAPATSRLRWIAGRPA